MGLELVSKNTLRTNRYITDYGLTTNTFGALIEVDLVVVGKVRDEQGFMMDMMKLRRLFYELIGECWDRGILIQKGECIDLPSETLVYVDFSPSLENIAREIFECLAPIIDQRYCVKLIKVVAKSDLGKAIYKCDYQGPKESHSQSEHSSREEYKGSAASRRRGKMQNGKNLKRPQSYIMRE